MPALPGLHEDRVRRVSLLQGHEEVWRARPDEAVLLAETVHGSKTRARTHTHTHTLTGSSLIDRCLWVFVLFKVSLMKKLREF